MSTCLWHNFPRFDAHNPDSGNPTSKTRNPDNSILAHHLIYPTIHSKISCKKIASKGDFLCFAVHAGIIDCMICTVFPNKIHQIRQKNVPESTSILSCLFLWQGPHFSDFVLIIESSKPCPDLKHKITHRFIFVLIFFGGSQFL